MNKKVIKNQELKTILLKKKTDQVDKSDQQQSEISEKTVNEKPLEVEGKTEIK